MAPHCEQTLIRGCFWVHRNTGTHQNTEFMHMHLPEHLFFLFEKVFYDLNIMETSPCENDLANPALIVKSRVGEV